MCVCVCVYECARARARARMYVYSDLQGYNCQNSNILHNNAELPGILCRFESMYEHIYVYDIPVFVYIWMRSTRPCSPWSWLTYFFLVGWGKSFKYILCRRFFGFFVSKWVRVFFVSKWVRVGEGMRAACMYNLSVYALEYWPFEHVYTCVCMYIHTHVCVSTCMSSGSFDRRLTYFFLVRWC